VKNGSNSKYSYYEYTKIILLAIFLCLSMTGKSQESLAILPFAFADDGHVSEQLGKEAQQFLAQYISKKQKHFTVVPKNSRDLNVALKKAGITLETFDDFTTSEIADAVDADFVLLGSVDRTFEGSTSVTSGFGSVNQKDWNTTNVYGSSVNSSTKKYHATVYISIFKKDGNVIYDKSKGNVFIDDTSNSWKNSIIWQVRHFPFYK